MKREAPVEMIEEKKQKLRTSRMDTRFRTPVPRRRRVGGWENKNNFGQGNNVVEEELRIDLAKDKEV